MTTDRPETCRRLPIPTPDDLLKLLPLPASLHIAPPSLCKSIRAPPTVTETMKKKKTPDMFVLL